MDFTQYIKPELLILIPVLYLIGEGIKKSEINRKYIPIILGSVGIILSSIYLFATTETSTTGEIATALFTGITQGILIAGATVYANQIIKQSKKEE